MAGLAPLIFDGVFPVLAAALGRHEGGRLTVLDAVWLEQIRSLG